jgi:hypothetical protein
LADAQTEITRLRTALATAEYALNQWKGLGCDSPNAMRVVIEAANEGSKTYQKLLETAERERDEARRKCELLWKGACDECEVLAEVTILCDACLLKECLKQSGNEAWNLALEEVADYSYWTRALHYLRANGWCVAVHNDYRKDGTTCTFWLLVDSEGWTVKGEGLSDAQAFNQIILQLPEVEQSAIRALKHPPSVKETL